MTITTLPPDEDMKDDRSRVSIPGLNEINRRYTRQTGRATLAAGRFGDAQTAAQIIPERHTVLGAGLGKSEEVNLA